MKKSKYRQWMDEYRAEGPGVSARDWLVQTGRAHVQGSRYFYHYDP